MDLSRGLSGGDEAASIETSQETEYQRLLDKLRSEENCWFYALLRDGISSSDIDKALACGDAVYDGENAIKASVGLRLRWLKEEQNTKPLHKLVFLPVAEPATIEANPPLPASLQTEETQKNTQPQKLNRPEKSPRAFAASWLRALLQEPRWAEDVLRLAEEQGISLSTLKRAKKAIGVASVKAGGYFGGADTRWSWRLN